MRKNAQMVAPGAPGLAGLQLTGKALSDASRLRILAALDGRELCVCHLVPLLGLDASTVSRHVGVLRDAGLVAVRREGRWLHCRRAQPEAAVWGWVGDALLGAPEVERDARKLRARDADCC